MAGSERPHADTGAAVGGLLGRDDYDEAQKYGYISVCGLNCGLFSMQYSGNRKDTNTNCIYPCGQVNTSQHTLKDRG